MIFYFPLFLVFFILLLSFWGFWQATHPPKIISSLTPSDLGWQFEAITLETSDGLKLAVWFIPSYTKAPTLRSKATAEDGSEGRPKNKKSDKAIVILHGYPADKGDLLNWAFFLKDKYNLLFLDFRYFGESEGSFTSFGYHERKDVLAAIKFLKENGINEIGLMGFSFGASVALLTLPETKDVTAVVADTPFANLDLMGETYYSHLPFLQKPLTTLTKFWGRVIYGIEVNEIASEEAVKKVQTPIFIIHSRQDETTLVENAERLKKALKDNPKAKVWIYDRGRHGQLGGEDYQEKILEFFEKNL